MVADFWRRRRLHALHADHAGQFQKGHAHLKQHRLQRAILGFGQVAAGLFRQHAQQIDGGARAQNVHPRTLALLRARPHLDHGGDVELLHQVFEADRRLRAHGGVLRPDHLFKPLRRGVVGRLLLAALLGGGRRRQFVCQFLALPWKAPAPAAVSRRGSFTTRRGPARAHRPDGLGGGAARGRLRGCCWLSLLFFRLHLAAVNHFKLRGFAHSFQFPSDLVLPTCSTHSLPISCSKAGRRGQNAGRSRGRSSLCIGSFDCAASASPRIMPKQRRGCHSPAATRPRW